MTAHRLPELGSAVWVEVEAEAVSTASAGWAWEGAMRLGILSDTHDNLARTRLAVQVLRDEGAEGMVHCGDLTGPLVVAACAVLPFWFVFGNHDADNVPTLQRAAAEANATCLGWSGVVELHGKQVAVAHGHMTYDIRHLLKGRPHYLLTGHLHRASDRREGLVRRINPGALHEADALTVALLDLESDDLRFLALPGA